LEIKKTEGGAVSLSNKLGPVTGQTHHTRKVAKWGRKRVPAERFGWTGGAGGTGEIVWGQEDEKTI